MFLRSINISKVFICFVFVILFSGCEIYENQTLQESIQKYEIKELNNRFEIVFYTTDNHKELFRKTFVNEPLVVELKKNLFKVVVSSGVNSNYSFFVDVEKSQISTFFFNLLYNDANRVAFLKDKTIFVTDIFNDENFYTEIERDFSETAVPQSAILSFEIIDNIIHIKYLTGKDYTEIYEEIGVKGTTQGDGSLVSSRDFILLLYKKRLQQNEMILLQPLFVPGNFYIPFYPLLLPI